MAGMRDLPILLVHLIVTLARLAQSGGLRSVVAESVLVRHQLLVLNRGRRRAPVLKQPRARPRTRVCAVDRINRVRKTKKAQYDRSRYFDSQ